MKNLFLSGLAKTINAYLALDPETSSRLEKLRDKVVTIELSPVAFIFQLQVTQQGLTLHLGETLPADTRIKGTPLQFFSVMWAKENRHSFFAEDISITGDADVAQQVIALFDALEIDWEEYLSLLTGDRAAHKMGDFARLTRQWLTKAQAAFVRDADDYIHEEAQWLPAREALANFFHDIDTLRMDLDRLEMRIKNLQQHEVIQ